MPRLTDEQQDAFKHFEDYILLLSDEELEAINSLFKIGWDLIVLFQKIGGKCSDEIRGEVNDLANELRLENRILSQLLNTERIVRAINKFKAE